MTTEYIERLIAEREKPKHCYQCGLDGHTADYCGCEAYKPWVSGEQEACRKCNKRGECEWTRW